MKIRLAALFLAVLAAAASAAKAPQVLKPGRYTAIVKALACEACGPKVVETVKAVPGVGDAWVEDGPSRLTFVVKPEAEVDVAALQKKLAAAAREMGMGADYTLRDIKALPARAKPKK